MTRKASTISFIVLFLTLCAGAIGQVTVKASVDRNKIVIGEPIELSVEAYMPLGVPIEWIKGDTIPHFEIDYRSAVDTAEGIDGKKVSQLFRITSFDSGRWEIPPFRVGVAGKSYFSDSIHISVGFVAFDPADDYRDIKDIVVIEDKGIKAIPWLIALTAVVAAILFIILYRRLRKKPALSPVRVNALTAYQEAMQRLSELKRTGAAQDEKFFYSSMNDTLRKYVSRKFSIPTFERTNEELIRDLSKLNLPATAFGSLSESLRIADFVKFAKYKPSEDDNDRNLETVKSSIQIMEKQLAGAV